MACLWSETKGDQLGNGEQRRSHAKCHSKVDGDLKKKGETTKRKEAKGCGGEIYE